jgi:hypothetical protein
MGRGIPKSIPRADRYHRHCSELVLVRPLPPPAMDKNRAAAIEAIAARGEQIKTNSAEFLWVCCGVKPPLPNAPVATDRNANSEDHHLRRFGAASTSTKRRAV